MLAGFTSATTELADAQHHALQDYRARCEVARRERGHIEGVPMGALLAIHPSLHARAAYLEPLSQYPHEREVALPPCTSLQVMNVRFEGALAIIDLAPTRVLPPLTLELLSARRRMILEEQAHIFGEEVCATTYTENGLSYPP